MPILGDDNADTFAYSLLILYCSSPYLNFSSIVIIAFYILSKKLHLKRKRLSAVKVVLLAKKEFGYVVHFLKLLKVFKVNMTQMISYSLMKLPSRYTTEDVPLWSYFGRDVPDHNRTEIVRSAYMFPKNLFYRKCLNWRPEDVPRTSRGRREDVPRTSRCKCHFGTFLGHS